MKKIDIRNLANVGVADVDVYNTNKTKLNTLNQLSTYISTKNIFVYKLISPEILIQKIRDIKNILYKTLGVADNNNKRSLEIDPIAGWITYNNYEYLDADRYRGISYTEKQIDEIAQTFFSKLSDINRNYTKNSPSVPIIFETIPKLLEIIPVYSDKVQPIRWIVRYNIYLDYTDHEKNNNVPVKDSLVEFLIDGYGVINSILIRWRPIERKIQEKLYSDEEIQKKKNDYLIKFLLGNTIGKTDTFNLYEMICSLYLQEAEKEDHHDAEEESTTIEYYLSGENTLQTHLTPFVIHQNGHHAEKFEIIPACLNISFDITSFREETKIKAIISNLEEKGSYSYLWSAWEIANPENFVNLGSSDSCSLHGGAFHLLLTVKNNRTGQTEQHQEHIFSTSPVKLQFEAEEKWFVWGCTDPSALNYNPNANCDDDTCKY